MEGQAIEPQKSIAYNANGIIKLGGYLAFLLNLGIWLVMFFNIKVSTEPIGLHYNIYFGINDYGMWYRLYLIPILGLSVIIINYIFGALAYRRERILGYLLVMSSVAVQFLLILGSTMIVSNI